ncbi:Tad domain-containing protein [Actinoplanes sp. RD1]|uniref:Tad domain-containing protein n=1 Tax=Actinoplanes sp. RD1 TaxID=3064538 RepID=UPI002742491B|nr:Tad domain-containing protein [Actinoplanes sp. RD1]
MRRLRSPRNDEGAVAVVVAVLLTGGVLLGSAALVIDVGGLYAKREQLQAGADAASWAIAEACIEAPDTCSNQAQQPRADELMAKQVYGPGEGNNLSAAAATQVCVDGIDCAAWNTTVECPSQRLSFGDYVEVRAYYQNGDDLVMPAPFAGLFGGQERGSKVGACSRVSWAPPRSLTVTALGLSAGCFDGVTYYRADRAEEPTGFVPLQSLPDPDPAGYVTAAPDGTCQWKVLGDDFGTRDCLAAYEPRQQAAVSDTSEPATGDEGAWQTACSQAVTDASNDGEPLLLPVFDTSGPIDDGGEVYSAAAAGEVTVVGFAAFRPTESPGDCAGDTCLTGYFTKVLAPRSRPRFTDDVPRDFGVTVIGRTG